MNLIDAKRQVVLVDDQGETIRELCSPCTYLHCLDVIENHLRKGFEKESLIMVDALTKEAIEHNTDD